MIYSKLIFLSVAMSIWLKRRIYFTTNRIIISTKWVHIFRNSKMQLKMPKYGGTVMRKCKGYNTSLFAYLIHSEVCLLKNISKFDFRRNHLIWKIFIPILSWCRTNWKRRKNRMYVDTRFEIGSFELIVILYFKLNTRLKCMLCLTSAWVSESPLSDGS